MEVMWNFVKLKELLNLSKQDQISCLLERIKEAVSRKEEKYEAFLRKQLKELKVLDMFRTNVFEEKQYTPNQIKKISDLKICIENQLGSCLFYDEENEKWIIDTSIRDIDLLENKNELERYLKTI